MTTHSPRTRLSVVLAIGLITTTLLAGCGVSDNQRGTPNGNPPTLHDERATGNQQRSDTPSGRHARQNNGGFDANKAASGQSDDTSATTVETATGIN